MGFFDKKYCDICGEKIGLLGNRKLEDGNLCKDCSSKLSPFFSGRRSATVEEIKQQLAYREENKQKLASFRPSKTFGESRKVYIDEAAGTFIVTGRSNWRDVNPDLISLSQVTACNTDIQENRDEIYQETEDGKSVSYTPPRYEYSYEFKVQILVNSPWFSEINLELSDGNRPDSKYTEQYREYERQMYELSNALMARSAMSGGGYGQASQSYAQPAQNYGQSAAAFGAAGSVAGKELGTWFCPSCGTQNSGAFCQNCGTKKPQVQRSFQCDKCGWKPGPDQQPPKFCPQCGDPFDSGDIV